MRRLKISSLLVAVFLAGCQSATSVDMAQPIESSIEVIAHDGTMSDVISHAGILSPEVALTFNGLADNETMQRLLNVLEQFDMKATFFSRRYASCTRT